MDKKDGLLKRVWRILKEPKLIVVCVNWFITLAGIIGSLILCINKNQTIITYVIYSISALSLSYSVYTAIKFAPTLYESVQKKIKSNKYAKLFTENYSVRTIVMATLSFTINLGFVIFNGVIAVLSQSIWYGALGGYYFLLSLLKGWLFYADKKLKKKSNNEESKIFIGQVKNYRICGIALLILEIAMTGVVTLMVLKQNPTQYSNIIAIGLATFTFYKITMSIINVIKARTHKNVQVQILRNIGLAETALSLVSLQMALVATFSDGMTDMSILNAIVGFTACAFVIGIGIFMIVRATKILKQTKKEEIQNIDDGHSNL